MQPSNDRVPLQRPFEQRVDGAEILGRQFCQRTAEIVRNRQLGREHAGEVQLAERVRIVERHRGRDSGCRE